MQRLAYGVGLALILYGLVSGLLTQLVVGTVRQYLSAGPLQPVLTAIVASPPFVVILGIIVIVVGLLSAGAGGGMR